jgi:hypothetical protein
MDWLFPGRVLAPPELSGSSAGQHPRHHRWIEAPRAKRLGSRLGLTRWLARLRLALQHRARPRRATCPWVAAHRFRLSAAKWSAV